MTNFKDGQTDEIEALLERSRVTTAAIAKRRATRAAEAPYGVTRIAPCRVPAPPPAPQRDRFMAALLVRLRTRA